MFYLLVTLHVFLADDLPWDIACTSRSNASTGIYLVSQGHRKLLSDRFEDAEQPAWSPDGRQIAFSARDKEGWHIDVLALDSGRVEKLTAQKARDTFPAWSPDGRTIAFTSDRGNSQFENNIYLIAADGKNQRRFTTEMDHTEYPCWSPNGRFLVYSAKRNARSAVDAMSGARPKAPMLETFAVDLYIARADGTARQQLTHVEGISSEPAWSPDGKTIAFWSNREAGPLQLSVTQIYSISLDGSNCRQLTHLNAQCLAPKWSPDSKKIVFHASEPVVVTKNGQQRRTFKPAKLYVIDADGSNPTRLTTSDTDEYFPAFRPLPTNWHSSPALKK